MGYPLKSLCFATAAAVWVLAAPAVQAFTIENKDQDGTATYAVPKFDIREQARQFSSGGSSITVLTPASAGTATGSAYCGAIGAFDAQPTWDAVNQVPVGDQAAIRS